MGRSNTQQTTVTRPDEDFRQRFGDLYNRAQQHVDMSANSFFQGPRVAGFNPLQQSAMDFVGQRFAGGGPDLASEIQRFQNPYEDQVVGSALSDLDRFRQMAVQGNRSEATMAGAFGGDRSAILEAETNRGFADTAARTAAQLRSQGFNTAADLANQDFNRQLTSANTLFGFGGYGQQQAQSELDDRVGQFYERRDRPMQQIDWLRGLLDGSGGMQSTTSTPTNRAAGALGGALSGASAGAAFGPWGAAIGGGLGGLLGLF